MSAVEKMLQDGFPVNRRGVFGRTALWLASFWGHLELVKRLLEAEADPTLADVGLESDTPLHCAAFRGHLAVVAVLIEAGADVNAVNNRDRTPFENSLMSVHRERRLQLAALFTQAGGGRIALGLPVIAGELPPPATPVVAPTRTRRGRGAGAGAASSSEESAEEEMEEEEVGDSGRRQVVLNAPPCSSAGDLLLLRMADGAEYEVLVPAHAAAGRHFTVQLPATACCAPPTVAGIVTVGVPSQPAACFPAPPTTAKKAPKHGRPQGVPLATPDESLCDVIAMEPTGIEAIDLLAKWLGEGGGDDEAVACRQCAVALVMRGVSSARELAKAPREQLVGVAGPLLSAAKLQLVEARLDELVARGEAEAPAPAPAPAPAAVAVAVAQVAGLAVTA